MELRSARRKFRTRPSSVRPVIMNVEDITRHFAHRNSVNEDPNYDWNAVMQRHNSAAGGKRTRQLKKPRRKPRKKHCYRDVSLAEVKKVNALFEDVQQYSLIVEKVAEDDYVMTNLENSVSFVETALHASTSEFDSFVINRKSAVIEQNSRGSILESPDQLATPTPSKRVFRISRFSREPFTTSTPMAGNGASKLSVLIKTPSFLSEKDASLVSNIPQSSEKQVDTLAPPPNDNKNSLIQLEDESKEMTGNSTEVQSTQEISTTQSLSVGLPASSSAQSKPMYSSALNQSLIQLEDDSVETTGNSTEVIQSTQGISSTTQSFSTRLPASSSAQSKPTCSLTETTIEAEGIVLEEEESSSSESEFFVDDNDTNNKENQPDYVSLCASSDNTNESLTSLTSDGSISHLSNPLKRFYYLRDFDAEPTDLNFLLHVCEQKGVMTWEELLPQSFRRGTRKLGEGAYGEVFKTKVNETPVALKVIPFMDENCTYDGLVNGEHMKHTMEILPELLITKELSELANENRKSSNGFVTPNFVRLVQASVVKGNYPTELLTEWDRFARVTNKSENDRPDTYASEDQLFIVFALSLGGKDLESYTIKNEREAWSIFFQIALSLSVAEETIEFEHRDLHWGNVLIDNCKAATPIKYILNGKTTAMKSCGVCVSIIDFTNSRMQREGTIIYLDLSKDEELFKGEGDYQFDVYRMMREANKDEWQYFKPYTNSLWLHYIATKVFASSKITAKRRREVMSIVDKVLEHERIKSFLDDGKLVEIFDGYVLKEDELLCRM